MVGQRSPLTAATFLHWQDRHAGIWLSSLFEPSTDQRTTVIFVRSHSQNEHRQPRLSTLVCHCARVKPLRRRNLQARSFFLLYTRYPSSDRHPCLLASRCISASRCHASFLASLVCPISEKSMSSSIHLPLEQSAQVNPPELGGAATPGGRMIVRSAAFPQRQTR